jgi:hypothetical protein
LLTPEEEATLDRLRDEDYDLTDGVFTHRAPDSPKAEPAPGGTAFVLGSCQYPRGFIDEPVAYEAWGHLLERIDGVSLFPAPQFALLCGDQVYVDATAGLFDPTMEDDTFELPNHRWLRNDRVREVLRHIPSFMLLDDHEIEDNWEPIASTAPTASDNDARRDAGVKGFRKFQRGMNAPPTTDNQSYDFRIEGCPIFILDTRSTRDRRTAGNLAGAQLFDMQTLGNLSDWLTEGPSIPKFVVSPSMLLPRHRRATQWNELAAAVRSDAWDGYPATLHAVLSRIVDDGNVQHVVFLSGDEHCGSVATIDITNVGSGVTKRIHSIHTCGTYTPYPFANGSPSELMGSETFDFQHGGSAYRCVVSTAFAATRNRFTYLNLRKDGADWLLEHQFDDGPVGTLVV